MSIFSKVGKRENSDGNGSPREYGTPFLWGGTRDHCFHVVTDLYNTYMLCVDTIICSLDMKRL